MKKLILPLALMALSVGACKKEASQMQSPTSVVKSNAVTPDTVYVWTDNARTDTLPGIKRDWNEMSNGTMSLPYDLWDGGGYRLNRVVWTLHQTDGIQWKSARQDISNYFDITSKHAIPQTTAHKVKIVFEPGYVFPIPSKSDLPWWNLHLSIQATGTRGSYMTADLDSLYITRFGVPVPVKIRLWRTNTWQTKPGENQTVKFGYIQ